MVKVVTFVLLFISPLLVASFSLNPAGKWKNEIRDDPAVRVGRVEAILFAPAKDMLPSISFVSYKEVGLTLYYF